MRHLLLVAVQLLYVYSVHHFVALDYRRLVELLTATEFFYNACFLKFTFEFLGSFSMFSPSFTGTTIILIDKIL